MGMTVPPSPASTPSATPTTNSSAAPGQQTDSSTTNQDAFSQFMTRMVKILISLYIFNFSKFDIF